MKQLIATCLIFFAISSCKQREVKLPETNLNAITEITDVSAAYIFYNEDNRSVEFNRKNLISTTNWLINIDKRSTLKQILPHLQYLQEKRNKASMHKNQNARNYFTCFNSEDQGLSFIDFTETWFTSKIENELQDYSQTAFNCHIRFDSEENIEMEKISEGHIVKEDYNSISGLINEIKKLLIQGNIKATLAFNPELTFNEYIKIKSELYMINSDSLEIVNQELIHN